MNLTKEQREKYGRNILLNEIGEDGQKKLLEGKVLVVGAGGLGSPALMYLGAAGVGTIGIADGDVVDLSNLQRQIIHSYKKLGMDKVISAKRVLEELNPDVNVITYKTFLNEDNIADIVKDYDFVIECTDNFNSKFLVNDACVKAGKPFCHGGIMGFEGQVMTYLPNKGPCYRCIFEQPPENFEIPKGVLGAVAGVAGCIQAMEAVKYLTDVGKLLVGQILTFNGLTQEFRKVKFPFKNKNCKACSQ